MNSDYYGPPREDIGGRDPIYARANPPKKTPSPEVIIRRQAARIAKLEAKLKNQTQQP